MDAIHIDGRRANVAGEASASAASATTPTTRSTCQRTPALAGRGSTVIAAPASRYF